MNWIKWLSVWFTIQWNRITGKRKEQEKQRKRIEGIQNSYQFRRYPPTPKEVFVNNNKEIPIRQVPIDYGQEYWDRKKQEDPDLGSFGLGYLAGDILNDIPSQVDSSPSSNEPGFDGFSGGDGGGSGSSGSWDSSGSSSSDSSSYDSGSSDCGSSDSSSSSD